MGSSPIHVILIRTPLTPLSSDPYESSHPSLTIHHLPVLSTSFCNSSLLSSILSSGPQGHYSGVVVTSSRSVEAWGRETGSHTGMRKWDGVPFFAVGKGTRDCLLRLPDPPPISNIHASETTGSGFKLATFIISHYIVPPTLPLLYLVGDKNRETIPSMLGERGIGLERVQVYGCEPCEKFEGSLDRILEGIPSEGVMWVTLFSPSGAKHALKVLRGKGVHLRRREEGEERGGRVRVGVIGPTTREYVEEEEGLWVHAVAKSPEPRDLWQAMREA